MEPPSPRLRRATGWRIGGWPSALILAAVLEEKQLCGLIREVKANRAIAADEIARDAAASAHAVDLVNAGMRPDIEFAPRFDQRRSLRLVGQKKLQRRSFVLEKTHGRSRFDRPIVETRRFH